MSKRRAHGSGTIFQRGDGKWIARVRTVNGPHKRSANDEHEAELLLAGLIDEYRDDLSVTYHEGRPAPSRRFNLPRGLRFTVLERDDFRCQYCGARAPETPLTVDHVISIADGGTDDLSNLVAACWACNLGKRGLSVRHPHERSSAD